MQVHGYADVTHELFLMVRMKCSPLAVISPPVCKGGVFGSTPASLLPYKPTQATSPSSVQV
jgi:hypothetical protein